MSATVSGNLPPNYVAIGSGAVTALYATLPIGSPVAQSEISAAIRNALVAAGGTNLSLSFTSPPPGVNVALADGEVPTAGTFQLVGV